MLNFKSDTHEYFWHGAPVPSVTQIIQSANLANFDSVPWHILKKACELGTYVHQATEYLDNNTLDFDTIDEGVFPYLQAWERFKIDTGFKIKFIEVRLYSQKYKFAGTIDRIGTINDKEVIPDIKTGVHSISHAVQTSAYAQLAKEAGILTQRKANRLTVKLNSDGSYSLKPHKGNADFAVFLNALAIYNYKKRMR